MKFSTKHFTGSRKFSTNKEVFQKKVFFLDKGSIPQTNIFMQSKKFSANKDQKGSLKAKILDPFNTKFYAKTFLTL